MLVSFSTALWPAPIVVDTSAPASGGAGGVALSVLRPAIDVYDAPGGVPLISWAPYGRPEASAASFVGLAAVALVLAFAVVGVAHTLK